MKKKPYVLLIHDGIDEGKMQKMQMKKKIQKLLGKEVKNKDVTNIIIKAISKINGSLESLKIFSE